MSSLARSGARIAPTTPAGNSQVKPNADQTIRVGVLIEEKIGKMWGLMSITRETQPPSLPAYRRETIY